jgi:hypothetical protein
MDSNHAGPVPTLLCYIGYPRASAGKECSFCRIATQLNTQPPSYNRSHKTLTAMNRRIHLSIKQLSFDTYRPVEPIVCHVCDCHFMTNIRGTPVKEACK